MEQGEKLWLYQVEDAVLMVEVQPTPAVEANPATRSIGQVVLKRLITAEQAIELLCNAELFLSSQHPQLQDPTNMNQQV